MPEEGFTRVDLDDEQSEAFWDAVAGPLKPITVNDLVWRICEQEGKPPLRRGRIRKWQAWQATYLREAVRLQAGATLAYAQDEIDHKQYMERFKIIQQHAINAHRCHEHICALLCLWATEGIDDEQERANALATHFTRMVH